MNLVGLVAAVVMLVATGLTLYSEFPSERIVVRPFELPKSIAAKGYTGDGLARDFVRAIDEALTWSQRGEVETLGSLRNESMTASGFPHVPRIEVEDAYPAIEVPSTDADLRSILRYCWWFYGRSPQLWGEVVIGGAPTKRGQEASTTQDAGEAITVRLWLTAQRSTISWTCEAEGIEHINFRQCLEEDPDFLGAIIGRGRAARYYYSVSAYEGPNRYGDFAAAAKLFTWNEPSPTAAAWVLNVEGLFAEMEAMKAEEAQAYEDALLRYAEALARYEESIGFDEATVAAWINKGNTLAAIDDLCRTDGLGPDVAVSACSVCDDSDCVATAEAAYRTALEGAESGSIAEIDAFLSLAELVQRDGRFPEAVTLYESAIGSTHEGSTLAVLHTNLGLVYFRDFKSSDQGERTLLEVALEHQRRAVEFDPYYALAWSNWGSILQDYANTLENAQSRRRTLRSAVAKCQRAIRLRPDYALAILNLGLCYLDLEDQKQAEDAFRRGLASQGLRPWLNAALLENLAKALFANGECADGSEILGQFRKDYGSPGQDVLALEQECAANEGLSKALSFVNGL